MLVCYRAMYGRERSQVIDIEAGRLRNVREKKRGLFDVVESQMRDGSCWGGGERGSLDRVYVWRGSSPTWASFSRDINTILVGHFERSFRINSDGLDNVGHGGTHRNSTVMGAVGVSSTHYTLNYDSASHHDATTALLLLKAWSEAGAEAFLQPYDSPERQRESSTGWCPHDLDDHWTLSTTRKRRTLEVPNKILGYSSRQHNKQ